MVEKQNLYWKPKEKTAAKGSGKIVLYHMTIILLNVFYMFKPCEYPSDLQEILKNTGLVRFSPSEEVMTLQQKKATYSYFWHLSPIYKGIYFTLMSDILSFQNIYVAVSNMWNTD